MKNIVKILLMLGSATLVSLLVAVFKRKVMAIYLGPVGLGIYAQVFNYFNLATIIASFGLSQGITTFMARDNYTGNSKSEMDKILSSAISLSLLFSFLLVLITVIFSKNISALILNNRSIYYLLILVSFGIPFQVFGESMLSYLQGMKRIKKISLASIIISILGLVTSVPLIIYFDTPGAVISTLVLAVITFIIYVYFCKDVLSFKFFWGIFRFFKVVKYHYFPKIFKFGLLRFIQTALTLFTFFIMRILIINKIGIASNGIYEAIYTFSLLYLPLLSSILWSYSYPEYCQAQDNATLSKAVNKFLRLFLTITFPFLVILTLGRSMLVERMLFTQQFHLAVKLIPIRFLVDLLTVITWSFSVVLLAKDRLGVVIKFEFIKDILFLGAVMSVVSTYKLKGLLIMDAVSCLLLFLLSYRYVKKHFNFALLRKNKQLLLSSLLLLVVIGSFPKGNLYFVVLGFFILISWLLYFVSRLEMKEFFYSLRLIYVNR